MNNIKQINQKFYTGAKVIIPSLTRGWFVFFKDLV